MLIWGHTQLVIPNSVALIAYLIAYLWDTVIAGWVGCWLLVWAGNLRLGLGSYWP